MKLFGRLIPLAVFAAGLATLQWLAGTLDPWLPLKTLAAFALGAGLFAAIPWKRLSRRLAPGRWWYAPVLFLLFLRHFTAILGDEPVRVLRARSLVISRRYGAGWLASLAHALAALFRRAIDRAERFYAAQLVRGLSE
jgi:energy-coupling factor transporter transmembrane protein EcfT